MNVAVDVCVCTFRRPGVRDTLRSLAGQRGAPPFRVIVADNDDEPTARPLIEQAAGEFGLNLTYVHAPRRNISIARNACLDAATAPLLAFLDDDETASEVWLAALIQGLEGCDAVFGPVRACYPEGAPDWVRRGDFHTTKPAFRAGGTIDTGYSGNVLVRRAAIGDLRFDPALGTMGGEDTVFFAAMHRRGAKLGYCAEAAASEPVPVERAKLSWLMRRSFRSGQSMTRLLWARGSGSASIALTSLAKAGYCGLATVVSAWSPVAWRRNLIRGALHVGALAKALGARDAVMYGGAGALAPDGAVPTPRADA